ncbi:MAG: hypothetical protein ACRDYA_21180, partial [Egibacteraceae bacterium]
PAQGSPDPARLPPTPTTRRAGRSPLAFAAAQLTRELLDAAARRAKADACRCQGGTLRMLCPGKP